MRTSDSIADLAGALALAQGAFANPSKDRTVKVKSKKTGVEYSFSYATFAAVLDSVRKPLADNGLSFVQVTSADEHGHLITTRLMHASGQWMEFDTPVFVSDEGGPQAFGSGVTYAKRYALTSLLGITADEDDDANAAAGNSYQMRARHNNNGADRSNDPIHEAREKAITEDRHLLVNGEERSSYAVDKEKKADDWISARKAELAKLTTERAILDWWADPDAEKKHEWLKKHFAPKYNDLWAAAEQRIGQVVRVPRDRNVMQAG